MSNLENLSLPNSKQLHILVYPSLTFMHSGPEGFIKELLRFSPKEREVTFSVKVEPSELGSAALEKIKSDSPANLKFVTQCPESFDLMITLGGDGSVLWANQFIKGRKPAPTITINGGTLGFITQFVMDDLSMILDEISHACEEHRTSTLQTKLLRKLLIRGLRTSGESFESSAINEVVLKTPDNYGRSFQVFVGQALAMEFKADGVIICSQLGSTGYNSSVQGPLLAPGFAGLAISALAPYGCNFRPLVVPEGQTVKVVIGHSFHSKVGCSLDSTTSYELCEKDSVEINLEAEPIPLITRGYEEGWYQKARSLFHM